MPMSPPMHKPPKPLGSAHEVDERKRRRKEDPHAQFASSRRWRRFRLWFLRQHPLCQACGAAAQDVHHKVDRRDMPGLAFVEENCTALCHACHSRVTAQTSFARG